MTEDDKRYRAFLAGNQSAFEQLVFEYREKLIYFIYRYVKDLYVAEELAQDTFVEILIHKERYRINSGFKTYLYTIGHHKAVDFIRKQTKHVLVETITDTYYSNEEYEELESHIIKKEEKDWVRAAIKRLKEDYQVAIYLADYEELSYHEISKVLNKTLPQVKVLIHRARKALKKVLEQEELGYEK